MFRIRKTLLTDTENAKAAVRAREREIATDREAAVIAAQTQFEQATDVDREAAVIAAQTQKV